MTHDHERLGEILLELGIISQEQMDAALRIQHSVEERVGEILLRLNFLTSAELAQAIARQNGLEYIDIDTVIPSGHALGSLDHEVASALNVLPLSLNDGVLQVVTSSPEDEELLESVRSESGMRLHVSVGDANAIARYIDLFYEWLERPIHEEVLSQIQRAKGGEHPDIIAFFELLVKNAILERATDVHIAPGAIAAQLFFRIDGLLKHAYAFPNALHRQLMSRIKVLADMDITRTRYAQKGDFKLPLFSSEYNIRVSTLPTVHGEKIALRLQPYSYNLFNLESMGFEPDVEARIARLLGKQAGVIFIIGSSGSGKTSSLYAMLRRINVLERHVVTVEDPVEYMLPFVNQTEVSEKIDYTFTEALYHFARQDPDVIAVGEILDGNTARLAVRGSATGHLVLSTMSGNTPANAIAKLKDYGVERHLLADGLLAILSQRLVRRLCVHCKKERTISREALLEQLGIDAGSLAEDVPGSATVYEPSGCLHCRHTGFLGRIVLTELFEVDEAMREMIELGKGSFQLTHQARKAGMRTMTEDGLLKILQGITSIDEVHRVSC